MGASGQVQSVIPVVSGVIIALFGLSMIFDFARFLNREFRFHAREGGGRSFRDSGPGAFLLGLTFAAGWSPCIGPILASILLFAGKDGNILRSVVLLLMYSAGLGLPFVLSALFFDRLAPVMQFLKRNGTMVRRASGVLLALFGLAMAFGSLSWFSGLAVGTGYQLQSIRETRRQRP